MKIEDLPPGTDFAKLWGKLVKLDEDQADEQRRAEREALLPQILEAQAIKTRE